MDNVAEFKKKNYICLLNIKNLNNHITKNFVIIREVILDPFTYKIVRKFV